MTFFPNRIQTAHVLTLVSGLMLALFTCIAIADSSEGPVSKSHLDNVAIGGHDTVAYHQPEAIAANRATTGGKQWVHEWRGAKWRFGSEQSYLRFKANPAQYQPAFGGFCSNALSLGEGLIRTDGSHWEIFDDQLHLFFASRGRDRWLDGNHTTYRQQAEQAWQEITDAGSE